VVCLVKSTPWPLYTWKSGPVFILHVEVGPGVHFTRGSQARCSFYRRPGDPRDRSGRARENSPPTWFWCPDRPAREESLCRLSYPAVHLNCHFQDMIKVCVCHKDVWGTGGKWSASWPGRLTSGSHRIRVCSLVVMSVLPDSRTCCHIRLIWPKFRPLYHLFFVI
jgi:hypothetical protein